MQSESLSCSAVRRLLDSYACNELRVETNVEILEHLDRCADCALELDSIVRLRAAVRRAAHRETVPPETMASIRDALPQKASRPGAQRWVAAAMVLLALTLGGAGYWYMRTPMAGESQQILNMGLDVVEHCGTQSGQESLGWEYEGLAEILGEEMPSNYGIAAAHRCMHEGRLFIHVSLEAGDSRVSFVVTEKQGETFSSTRRAGALDVEGVPIYSSSIRNHQVAGFETPRHLVFLVTGGLSRDLNLKLASSIAKLHAPSARSTLKEIDNAN